MAQVRVLHSCGHAQRWVVVRGVRGRYERRGFDEASAAEVFAFHPSRRTLGRLQQSWSIWPCARCTDAHDEVLK
jgi:hypothetical protein